MYEICNTEFVKCNNLYSLDTIGCRIFVDIMTEENNVVNLGCNVPSHLLGDYLVGEKGMG